MAATLFIKWLTEAQEDIAYALASRAFRAHRHVFTCKSREVDNAEDSVSISNLQNVS